MAESDSRPARVAILFALAEERAPFERRIQRNPHFSLSEGAPSALSSREGDAAHGSCECALACSGMGIRNAVAAAESLLETSSPSLLIVCGFGGGLVSELAPGSLLVATSVQNLCGADLGFRRHSIADSALISRAGSVRLSGAAVRCGPLVTVERVLTRVEEKQELATTPAMAVDMESAGAIRVAEQQGIPWLAVRAITDGVMEELPFDFNLMAGPDGVVDRGRVTMAALTHPWKIPALIRLGGRSARAARSLADFLIAFLEAKS